MIQFLQMIEEIKKCQAAGATTACIMQIYVYIDTLAFFGMPASETKNTRKHFIEWVEKYLKAEASQPYQYRGEDLYGARCAVLHTFASDADYHQSNPGTIRFGYTDGSQHFYRPEVDASLAIIGTASLIHDFIGGVENFLGDIKKRISNPTEKAVLAARLDKILAISPFPNLSEGGE